MLFPILVIIFEFDIFSFPIALNIELYVLKDDFVFLSFYVNLCASNIHTHLNVLGIVW